jgi:simple sugar transport system permease protein
LNALILLLAAVAALLLGAMMLLLLGVNPLEGYRALFEGAFGSTNALADTLVKATPLLLVGLGICIAFRAGVINIGGEGQMIMGALAATAFGLMLPLGQGWLVVPLALLMGVMGGTLWGGIAGVLKARFHVNEILSTIMMNVIAVQLMNFLLRGPMIDRGQVGAAAIPQTARLARAFDLPRLVPTRLHLGVAIAVGMAFLVYVLLWRTSLGFRIRAVGLNVFAARYAGMSIKRTTVVSLMLSGALCGLAGAIQVYGLTHRMVTDGTAAGFTGSAGFNGIVAALFGQLHPLGTIPASFFFGALLVGATKMQREVQVPAALIITLNGLIVIFVVSSELWRKRLARRSLLKSVS